MSDNRSMNQDEKKKYADILQLDRDIAWFGENSMWVPYKGQIIWLSDDSGTFKKGNGISMLGALPFLGGGGEGSSFVWGNGTGNVPDQTDLVSYLNTNYLKFTSTLTGLSVSGGTISSTDNILQAFGKLQNQLNSIASPMIYKGVWNALTNSPTLTSSSGTKGNVYKVNVSGSTNLDGITDWKAGDFAVYNGTTWDKWDATDAVTSVNGYIGSVSLVAQDLLMTGYVSGSGTISATDTVKEAIQKLNGNISSFSPSLTNTYIGVGNAFNQLTGYSSFIYENIPGIKKLSLIGSAVEGAQVTLKSGPREFTLEYGLDCYITTVVSGAMIFRPLGVEMVRISSTGVSIGVGASPTAFLHIRSGTGATASVKIDSGVLLTSIVGNVNDGALEYDGNNLFMILGSTRSQITNQTNTLLSSNNVWTATTDNTFTSSVNIGVNSSHSLSLGEAVNIQFGGITGTKIAKFPTQKMSFWGSTPVVQPSNTILPSTEIPVGGTPLSNLDTFDGYTISQIVSALRLIGILS